MIVHLPGPCGPADLQTSPAGALWQKNTINPKFLVDLWYGHDEIE